MHDEYDDEGGCVISCGFPGTYAPPRFPQVGTRMGGRDRQRFELLEELGEDVMGRLFRAWDNALEREVALRFLWVWSAMPGQSLDSKLLMALRAIARLDHENIVRVFDVSEWRDESWAHRTPPVPFLLTELLKGESLASLLRRERPGPRRTLEIMGAAAEGLAYAHAHGIVHGDLKPGNVFITRSGRVKLLDVGLAHLLSGESQPVPHQPAGCTPPYMAPEQWRAERRDPRIDLWAAGIMLYEMLTGELPYSGRSIEELRERILSAEPAPLVRERVPELPEEVERLVAELLAKEPGRRLGSASVLHERLLQSESMLGPELLA